MNSGAPYRWSAIAPKGVRVAPILFAIALCAGLLAAFWPFNNLSSISVTAWILVVTLSLALYCKHTIKKNPFYALVRSGSGHWQLLHASGKHVTGVPVNAWLAGFWVTLHVQSISDNKLHSVTIWRSKANKSNWRELNVWLTWELSLGERLRKGATYES